MPNDLQPEFVLKVNEIFHDVEADTYAGEHPEIFQLEKERWQDLAVKFFKTTNSLEILDIGTGTGFVPLRVCPWLKEGDTLVCSDISERMLERARLNLENQGFKNKFVYLKLADEKINLPDGSLDAVIMNSVLHHLPDTAKSLEEIKRVLRSGGRLIIAHEPHRDFFKHQFLWFNYKLWRVLTNPRLLLEALMKRAGLKSLFDKYFQDQSRYSPQLAEVNRRLLGEGLISEPLSPWKMGKIVDYYSASGFSVKEITEQYLPGWQLEFFATYNHLYRVFMYSHGNVILKAVNFLLGLVFPKYGATFTTVWRKP